MLKKTVAALACLFLCSCAAQMLTIQEFKDKYDFTKTFTVQSDYESLYKDLTDKASDCFHEKNIVSTSYYVDTEIYPGSKSAQLEFTKDFMGSKAMWMYVELKGLSKGRTQVSVWYETPEAQQKNIVFKWCKGLNVCE